MCSGVTVCIHAAPMLRRQPSSNMTGRSAYFPVGVNPNDSLARAPQYPQKIHYDRTMRVLNHLWTYWGFRHRVTDAKQLLCSGPMSASAFVKLLDSLLGLVQDTANYVYPYLIAELPVKVYKILSDQLLVPEKILGDWEEIFDNTDPLDCELHDIKRSVEMLL